jgi:16S rRNA processing protein RimM
MTSAAAPLVAVGEVLRPHGLRGEVRVRPLTDRPEERFGGPLECVLWDPAAGQRRPCRITSCRFDGMGLLVRIEGVESPEAAAPLAGRLLAVSRERVLPTAEGHFYPWQLEGARVVTADGRPVGVFAGVEPGTLQARWVVVDGAREWLIPAVPEIVREVSVEAQRIVIDPPEGLLDL